MQLSYLFAGQGSQKIGMGEGFYNSSNDARLMFEEASDTLGFSMQKLMFEPNDNLDQTEFSQPAILLVGAIALELFSKENKNIKPIFSLGHSLGEITANYNTGALSFSKALRLVHKRGLLMKEACSKVEVGMMVVIGLNRENLQSLCDEFNGQVWLANVNNDTQIVLAGVKKDLFEFEGILKENGVKRVLMLPMSVVSHCPLLKPIVSEFEAMLSEELDESFLSPVISNVTAKPYSTKKEALALLSKQLISPVEYTQSIKRAEQDSDIFIEFGASVLKGLNRKITKKKTLSIVDMKSLEDVLKEIL